MTFDEAEDQAQTHIAALPEPQRSIVRALVALVQATMRGEVAGVDVRFLDSQGEVMSCAIGASTYAEIPDGRQTHEGSNAYH